MNKNFILFFIVLVLLTVKVVSIKFTNFNMFGDEAQYWLWSKELDFGYFSKPPFLAWAIRFYSEILQDSFFYLKLFPSIVYFLIAWGVYALLKNVGLKNENALVGSLTFLFLPAVSFSSFIISTDLFLLLFWTLSLNELIKIVKYQKITNFIFLGIFIGLGILSKYAAIYFVLCFFILIIIDKNFRKIFFDNYIKFFLSFLCFIVILLPNLIWNVNNNWVTLQHTSDNANFENIQLSIIRGLEFLIIQTFMLGPFIVLGRFFGFKKKERFQNFFLIFSLPIILIVFIEAIIVRANANWAAPALISLYVYLYIGLSNFYLRVFNYLFNFVFCCIFFIMIGINYPSNMFNRISGLKDYAEEIYENASDLSKKNMVISDRLLFSSLNYELRKKNITFFMPHKEGAEITNHFKISQPLDESMNNSFTFIGSLSDINYLEKDYKLIKKDSPNQIFTKRRLDVYEVIFE